MVKFLVSLMILLFSSCDDRLGPMVSLDYYCPVNNFNICLDGFDNYELTWEYDAEFSENCSGTAFKFLIYSSNDSNFQFSSGGISLSINPEFDNIPNQYFLDENNIYHYKTDAFNNIGEDNFFTILVDYNLDNDQFSSDNPVESLDLNINGPSIDLDVMGCGENGYDSDCLAFSISHEALSCASIPGTELYRLIEYNGTILEEKLIDTLSDNSVTTDQVYLNLCDGSNIIDIDGVYTIDLGKEFCNQIYPNEDYTLKYFYKNNGINSAATAYSDMIRFNRNDIYLSSKPLSSISSRLYVNEEVKLNNYNQILLYNYDNSSLDNPDFSININEFNIEDILFENTRIFDLESIDDDNYFVLLIGDYSYSYYDDLLNLQTLDDELSGFLLIENFHSSDINNGDDFYMNKYEITSPDFNDSQNQGSLPIELNCSEALSYVENISHSEFDFYLPTVKEWEYAAGYNIFTHETSVYPWGNEIDAYYANYLNSDLPSDSTGTVGVGLHEWPSPFGLYDMSGNVMEWTLNELNECVAKGGNYLSNGYDLMIDKDHTQIDPDDTLGIGFRIIMKKMEN